MADGTRTRSRLVFTLKLALGVGLLAWLLAWDDNWRKVLVLFADVRPIYLLPFVAIAFVLIGISCLKWNLFLRERGVMVSFRRLFGLYVLGIFFNNFLPSSVGGDVVRAYYLGKQIGSQAQSLASVFLERLTGFIALVALATLAYATNPELREGTLITVSIGAMASGCTLFVVALWHPALVKAILGPLGRIGPLRRLVAALSVFHEHVYYFKDKAGLIVKAMGYSFLFHICIALNVYIAGMVLGIELRLWHLLALTPIIFIIASLPLTPNSLGVWEWAYSVYLIPAGATLEEGLAVALLIRARTLVTSIAGGLLFLLEQRPAAGPVNVRPDG